MAETRERLTALAPFDAARACPKCAGTEVTTNYQAPRRSGSARRLNGERVWIDDPLAPLLEGEYLLRTCRRCHFQWPEGVTADV